jgi:NitT/TauT family transport system permease protein
LASTDLTTPAIDRAATREISGRAVAFRGGGFIATPKPMLSWIAFAALIAVWQLSGTLGWVSPIFLPSPSAIVSALWRLSASGELSQHISASLMRIGGGWAIGTLLGLFFGVFMGLLSWLRAISMPLVSAL